MEGYFHQKIKVVLMDVIGSKCVWKSRCDWSTHSVISWESYSIFTCELVWKISGLNLVWNFLYMKFFIHEIGVNFLSGIFNLVPHVKFLICIHFKHVSGVNQVWNRHDLMRIFCTGRPWSSSPGELWLLIGTPSGLQPQLAYSVDRLWWMSRNIFDMIFFVTLDVCLCASFYNLSTLVGC